MLTSDGTGSNLVHGYVEKRGRRLGSSAPFLIVISTALELCSLATGGTQERSEWRDLSTTGNSGRERDSGTIPYEATADTSYTVEWLQLTDCETDYGNLSHSWDDYTYLI